MPNHPNRSSLGNSARNPDPGEIRSVRIAAGLTQAQAADMIYATVSAWESWEQGLRRMHPGLWELFHLKIATTAASSSGTSKPYGNNRKIGNRSSD